MKGKEVLALTDRAIRLAEELRAVLGELSAKTLNSEPALSRWAETGFNKVGFVAVMREILPVN